MKNNAIFGDGTNYIFTVIDEYKSNLLEGLNKFKICFGSSHFSSEYYIELVINLGENFGIDYENCKLKLDNCTENIKKEDYEKILTRVYVNKGHLKE